MAEEANTQQPAGNGQESAQAPEPQQPPTPSPGDGGDSGQGEDRNPVPYERFQEVNAKARQLEERMAEIEKERKAQREKELAEQNKWKELYEEREKELQTERLNNLRQRVAMEKKIPAPLVDRLQGATAEELAADADRILEAIRPAGGPGNPPPPRNPSSPSLDLSEMTPAQIRELSGNQS